MRQPRLKRGTGVCPNKGRRRHPLADCLLCYTNVTRGPAYPGHIGWVSPRLYVRPFESYVMKRPEGKVAGARSGGGVCSDEQLVKRYPTIMLYLTDAVYDDGGAREVSALSVSVRDGQVALALNDKDLKQSLYTQAETLPEAMKLMEGALVSGTGEWRPWKAGKKK